MKKIIIFALTILLLIPINVKANTFDRQIYVSAQCAILMDYETGRIIYQKNAHHVRLIASITKIMTAIVAIENKNLDDVVKVGKEINGSIGSSVYLTVGTKMALRDLLYGMMLRSGNDAASAIAHYVGGSVEDFVAMMNLKAQEIGMINTTFLNPHGLDDDGGNYSTAYDMAKLTKYAMNNEEFREIFGTKKHTIKFNGNSYVWYNKNKLLNIYEYTIGGKTGYTKKAKRTLVSVSSKDDFILIAVTLNAGNDWRDHMNMYDFGYENYELHKILDKEDSIKFDDNIYKNELYIKDDLLYPLAEFELDKVSLKYEIEEEKRPVNGEIVGEVQLIKDGEVINRRNIYIKVDKKEPSIWVKIYEKIKGWFDD